MKAAIGLMALSGLASSAFAQSGAISMTVSPTTIDFTSTNSALLSIWGDADFGTHVAGGGFSLTASGDTEIVADMVASAASWGSLGFQDNGYSGDAHHDGVIFGQFILPPFIPPHDASRLGNGPVLLSTIEVIFHRDQAGRVNWLPEDLGEKFVMEIYDEADGSFTRLSGSDITFSGVSIGLPAPSAIALLGFGGLMTVRRRR